MRLRAVLGSIVGSITVLVVGWQVGAAAAASNANESTTGSTSTSTGTSTGSNAGSSNGGSTSSGSTSSGSATSSGTLKDGSYTGSTVNTQFGPMQVEVVISGGKITDVKALQTTNFGGRSVQISNQAVPILRQEVLSAQSANVNTVGGATYTSEGYLTSLQSALDKAKA